MTDAPSSLTAALADRYRIERELGAGGMATVYLAHDVRHDRKVALKVLRPELSAILGGERFLAEIKTTANLQHPHILGLFDSGEAAGLVFYVMPFVDGESLRDRLNREKQLPVDEAVRIALEVADALHYAHTQGIVHRDIKPENILLHGGHAMVADFGIALAASRSEGGSRMTETGMSLGTPHYMSPEQAMGEREITPKADIYALGCVLYEMLTAEPPFVGASAQAIIARVLTEEPRSLTLQRRTIPPNVEAAVRTALEKLPADRFASASEFAAALGRADFSLAATRGAPSVAAQSLSRRGLVMARLPWALLVVAIGVAAWAWPRAADPDVTRQRVVLRDWPFFAGFVGQNVTISPDGRTIVFLDTVRGSSQLWSKESDLLEATPLAGTIGGVGPVFSPNGDWIAFVADGKLKKVPRLGGSSITVADTANADFPSIAWLESDSIVFNGVDFRFFLVHQDGGPRRVIRDASSNTGIVSATGLPKGRGVLVGVCNANCTQVELNVIDLPSGTARVLVDEVIKGWHTADGHLIFVRQDGGVFRVPFDLDELVFLGAPVPILDGVRAIPGRADLVLGASGMMIYAEGSATGGGTPAEAVWVARDGTVTQIDASWSFVPSNNEGLALSPDGRRLALSILAGGSSDIWVKELDNGPFTRLSFAGTNIRPTWTRDGADVMYISALPGGNEDVRVRRADGTGSETTLVDLDRTVFEVVPTLDTLQLIVRLSTPPSRDIHLWRRGDSTSTPLLSASGYDEVMPALSPDGRWLAYSSNESGRFEVYVRPFPNADAGRWQVSRSGGTEPRWAHTGRELFYRDGAGGLVAVAVTPGPTFVSGVQRVLFSASGFLSSTSHQLYDLTRDDRRFVFMRSLGGPEEAGPNHLVLVNNWLAELRASAARR